MVWFKQNFRRTFLSAKFLNKFFLFGFGLSQLGVIIYLLAPGGSQAAHILPNDLSQPHGSLLELLHFKI